MRYGSKSVSDFKTEYHRRKSKMTYTKGKIVIRYVQIVHGNRADSLQFDHEKLNMPFF